MLVRVLKDTCRFGLSEDSVVGRMTSRELAEPESRANNNPEDLVADGSGSGSGSRCQAQ